MSEFDRLDTDSGNTVMVALDHGIGMDTMDDVEDPRARWEPVRAAS